MMGKVTEKQYVTTVATASLATLVQWWKERREADSGQFTKEHPVLHTIVKNPRSDDALKILTECDMANNAKYKALVDLLGKILNESREDGTCSKVLIGSRWPVTLAVLKGMLQLRFGNTAVVDYTADMKVDERKTSYDLFMGNDDKPWIMLATVATVGVGLNIQRAHHVVLYEPCGSCPTVRQFFHRACRRGQTEPVTHAYIIVNEASRIENRAYVKMDRMDGLQQYMGETVDLRDPNDARSDDEEIEEV